MERQKNKKRDNNNNTLFLKALHHGVLSSLQCIINTKGVYDRITLKKRKKKSQYFTPPAMHIIGYV